MVVNDLDVVRITVLPGKANPPLIVDTDTMLADALPFQLFEPVTRRYVEVVNGLGGIHSNQLPQHHPAELGRISADSLSVEETGSVPIAKALDHCVNVTRCVNNVKRYYVARRRIGPPKRIQLRRFACYQ
jgi:hypothetical protein